MKVFEHVYHGPHFAPGSICTHHELEVGHRSAVAKLDVEASSIQSLERLDTVLPSDLSARHRFYQHLPQLVSIDLWRITAFADFSFDLPILCGEYEASGIPARMLLELVV